MMFHNVHCPLERYYFSPSKCDYMYIAEIYAVLAKTVLIFLIKGQLIELSLLLQESELSCQSKEVVLLSQHCKYS